MTKELKTNLPKIKLHRLGTDALQFVKLRMLLGRWGTKQRAHSRGKAFQPEAGGAQHRTGRRRVKAGTYPNLCLYAAYQKGNQKPCGNGNKQVLARRKVACALLPVPCQPESGGFGIRASDTAWGGEGWVGSPGPGQTGHGLQLGGHQADSHPNPHVQGTGWGQFSQLLAL